jgi:hypothetical protein
MLVGSGDVLATLSRVLLAVGGKESRFLHRMHERMSQLEVNDRQWPYAVISESKDENNDGRVVDVS